MHSPALLDKIETQVRSRYSRGEAGVRLTLERRNVKTLLSIGGWTYSQDGHFSFITNAALRATFVKDAVKIVSDYGFDGMCVVVFVRLLYPNDCRLVK